MYTNTISDVIMTSSFNGSTVCACILLQQAYVRLTSVIPVGQATQAGHTWAVHCGSQRFA